MNFRGRRVEGMRKDRSGIWLIAAGLVLILGSRVKMREGQAVQGQRSGEIVQERQATREQKAVQGQKAISEENVGSIQLAGSSSMESYVSALAEGFMECYPDITVTVQFTGSSAGIAAAAAGSADIGISSRYLKAEEEAAGLTEYIVGLDGIALCGNPANGIGEITGDELCAVYTGEIRNWTELGGCDLPVVAVGREAGSGTRDAFEGLFGLEGRCAYANELDSTGAVMARILATPGAVGYVSFETVDRVRNGNAQVRRDESGAAEGGGAAAEGRDDMFSILCLDGSEPSLENVRNGCYPLYRPFVMAVKGELSAQDSQVRLWFAYVESEEGRRIAEQAGVAMIP